VFSDPLGLMPGEAFDSKGAAAADALEYINLLSIAGNTEYIGVIYLNPTTCKYYATSPVKSGCHGKKDVRFVLPPGMIVVGDYHTHGDYSDINCRPTKKTRDANNSDNFSTPDLDDGLKKSSKYPGWTKYLGTPSGNFLEYSPPNPPHPLVP